MSETDRRVYMFKGKEARLFNSPDDVPEGEGWQGAPYDLDTAPAKKPKGKKADAEPVADEGKPDGDSD